MAAKCSWQQGRLMEVLSRGLVGNRRDDGVQHRGGQTLRTRGVCGC